MGARAASGAGRRASPEASGAGRMAKPPCIKALYLIISRTKNKTQCNQGVCEFCLPWVIGKCIMQPSGSPEGEYYAFGALVPLALYSAPGYGAFLFWGRERSLIWL